MKLRLERPLVFFDLETTGLNIGSDRIVEMSYHKVNPDGTSQSATMRFKPVMTILGKELPMHIPEEASAIHHITDEDVKDCPTFKDKAEEIADIFRGSDIAGYNSNHFDIPLLAEEFIRAGLDVDLKRCHAIDAYTIFQRHEPRTLTAAYRFYCDKDLESAHSANADTMATYEVLMAQMERYEDLPDTVAELEKASSGGQRMADFAGRIAYDDNGQEIFNFGKYKGMRVADVLSRDPGYYGWILQGDFPQYTKNVMTRIYLTIHHK